MIFLDLQDVCNLRNVEKNAGNADFISFQKFFFTKKDYTFV